MKRYTYFSLLALLWMSLLTSSVRAAEKVWFDGRHAVTYTVKGKTDPVVQVALGMFCDDMRQVTGLVPVAKRKGDIVIRQQNAGNDGFRIFVEKGQIHVVGNSGRGTAYGILELSRMAGVSPWIWWGDIVPERKSRLVLDETFETVQQPSVEYRGIFINDEDWSLRPWSCRNYEPGEEGVIGARTYRKVFELLLRLRGNALWPAMHEGTRAFFQVPGAREMADSCGITLGSSHCEPMLRNNVGEWDVQERGAYNFITNRQAVLDYWAERLRELRSKDQLFTIGMRGIHDGSMEGVKTMQEKTDGLQAVIDAQQELLRRYVSQDISKVTQVFLPYKEVLEIYENGLRVPETATLMWCDDNYGYITRLSNAEEQRRPGGGGVYYHLSYWGRPHDYLWLTTTQPGLIYNEMRQAYDHQVRKIWIANVHDPKVAGYQLELFMDMAWDINSVSPSTLRDHYQRWLCRQFGEQAGRALLDGMCDFYRLCGLRRPEFMGWTQTELDRKKYPKGRSPVTQLGFTTAEGQQLLADYNRIVRQVSDAKRWVRPELRDAYFTAIEYPVKSAAAHARKLLVGSEEAYNEVHTLTRQYNEEVAGGKWNHLMSDHPRNLPVYGAVEWGRSYYSDAATQHPSPTTHHPVTSRNACDYDHADVGAQPVQMLGHSMNAVALPKGGSLSYTFQTDSLSQAYLYTALIPTQPNDGGDLRYRVAIDGKPLAEYSLKEPFRSERWKQNVLRGQTLRTTPIGLGEGTHTLTITALDDHIVVDQWAIYPTKQRQQYALF